MNSKSQPHMKANLLSFFLLWFSLNGFSQDSVYIISGSELSKYRHGFIVTSENDTLKGLICVDSDEKICFIKNNIKIKRSSFFKESSDIPHFIACEGNIKAFYRNGLNYEVHKIPPNNVAVFLNVLEYGQIHLYRLINDYKGANSAVNVIPGALGLLVMLGNAANYKEGTEEEFFDIKAYYLQKGQEGQILYVPSSEKKYREVVYPLVKDNPAFLKSLVGQYFDFQHLVDNISKYNQTAGKK